MLALDVLLDVTCCSCGEILKVTVRCEGESLTENRGAKALASLACPFCRVTNHVIFTPETGEVFEVMDQLRIVQHPAPSRN